MGARLGQGREDESWYVRDLGADQGRQLWRITRQTATRMGVTNAEGGVGTCYEAAPGETIWASIRRQTPWLDGMAEPGPFQRVLRDPGTYHRRIARPVLSIDARTLWLPDNTEEQRYIISAQNQLASLIDDLRSICRVVQPAPATLGVYGHEIRNLLILAATEVEMHWRGILSANGRTGKFNTNDYVALADVLGLRGFTAHFHPCPDIGPVAPFAGWNRANPTGSLPWYAAYNGVKHNREGEFEQASLGNAFGVIAACAVLLVAQFGERALTPELRRFVDVEAPDWPIEEVYLDPQGEEGWMACPHPALA